MSKFTNNYNDSNFIKSAKNSIEHKKQLEEKNNNQIDKQNQKEFNKENKKILVEDPINTTFSRQMEKKNKGFYWQGKPFNPSEQKIKPQIETQQNKMIFVTPDTIKAFNERRKAFYAKMDEAWLIKENQQKKIDEKKREEDLKKEKSKIKKNREFFGNVFKKRNVFLRQFFLFFSNNFKIPLKKKKIFIFYEKKKIFVKYKNFLNQKSGLIQNRHAIKIYLDLIKKLIIYKKFKIKSLTSIIGKLKIKKLRSSSYLNINCVLLKYLIEDIIKHEKTTDLQNDKDLYQGGSIVNIFEHMLCRAQLKYNYILKRGSPFDPETAFFSKNKLSFPYGALKRDKKLLIKKWEENNPFEDFFAIPKYNFYYKNHLPFNRNNLLKLKKGISLKTIEAFKKQFPYSEHIYKIFERVPSSTRSKPLYKCTLHFIKNRMFFQRSHFLKSYVRYNVPNIHYEFFIKVFEKLYKVKSKQFAFFKRKNKDKKNFWENKFKKRIKNKKGYSTKKIFMPFLANNIKKKALSYLHKKLRQPVNFFFFNFSSLIPSETARAKCQYLNRAFRKSLSFQTKSENFITMWLIGLFNKNTNLLTNLVINEIQKIRKPYFFFNFLKQFFVLLEQELKAIGIIGIKIRISGRFSTRTRAVTSNIKFGKLPLQTLETSFDYYYGQAITHYGATGVKIWIAYKSSKKTLKHHNMLKSLKYNLKYNLKDQIKKLITEK